MFRNKLFFLGRAGPWVPGHPSQDHFGAKDEKILRPILNFAPRGKLWPRGRSCPPGVNCPLGVKFSVCPSILLNSRQCSPRGVIEGMNIPPRGQISPLGAKFTSRGEVKNGPLNTGSHWATLVNLSLNLNANFAGRKAFFIKSPGVRNPVILHNSVLLRNQCRQARLKRGERPAPT
jgi:hypothetical protein